MNERSLSLRRGGLTIVRRKKKNLHNPPFSPRSYVLCPFVDNIGCRSWVATTLPGVRPQFMHSPASITIVRRPVSKNRDLEEKDGNIGIGMSIYEKLEVCSCFQFLKNIVSLVFDSEMQLTLYCV